MKQIRNAEIVRNTKETQIQLILSFDNKGEGQVSTGCGFLDHMLVLFSAHSRFSLKLACTGDTSVDYHHTTEDIGIALGQAFAKCLGDKRGISRYGSCLLPMDEALVLTAVDISGRSSLTFDLPMSAQKVGDFDVELVEEFLWGFVRAAGITLHVKRISGKNTHHIIECCFKSLARSLKDAVSSDETLDGGLPSTKGVL